LSVCPMAKIFFICLSVALFSTGISGLIGVIAKNIKETLLELKLILNILLLQKRE